MRKFINRPALNRRAILYYLLPLVLVAVALPTINLKTDISAFILSGDTAEEVLLASEMQSGALSRRYLLSVGAKAEESNVPTDVVRLLQIRLKNIPGVADVWSAKQQRGAVQTVQGIYSRYAGSLYSLNPETDLAELFSPQGLQERAGFLKKALLSPQAGLVKKIALQDPLLLTLNGFQSQSEQLQQQAEAQSRYSNLILETDMAGLDVPEQSRIQQAIKTEFAELNRLRDEQYQLEMTGVPVFAVATQNLIKGDIGKVSTLSSVALMFLFLLLFRSFSSLFQVFTLLAIVILSAILVTHFSFGYVHGMTIAIGSTLVGICIDYPIHAIVHARTVAKSKRREVVAKIWPSMLLGGLTTMIGYMALGGSGYPGFQQIAVYAGTGILVALLLTRFVLPDLIQSDRKSSLDIPLVKSWALFCRRYRIGLLLVLLVALVFSALGLRSLQWIEDMQQLTPELNYLKENDKRIRARMVSIEPGRFILVTGKNIEVALQKTEQVYKRLEEFKQQGKLTDFFGLYPWLLSAKQQQQNRQILQRYLTDENQELWQQALREEGLSVSKLGVFNYPDEPPLTLDTVFTTPVKRLIDSRIMTDDKQTLVMIWLAEHDYDTVKAAFSPDDGVSYFSYRDLLNGMLNNYTDKARNLLLGGLSLIVLLLIIRYRSLLKAVQTLLPAILAAFFILGLWSLTGALVSFLHLVGFLLAVAICVDYGIFYQENRGGDIALTYQAMAASMLTSALAFGSLIAAESASLRVLSGVVALGVLLGFLFCPIIIRHRDA